jgi:hypothetical protein
MLPSGSDPACSGPRPVLLYAHGTSPLKSYDMSKLDGTEARMVAAIFAAQGFIVVAPPTTRATPAPPWPATPTWMPNSNRPTWWTACAPQHPLRQWLKKNDLRNYLPGIPLLLCGGDADPIVPYYNTNAAAGYFGAQNMAAVRDAYHAGLAAPFCLRAARDFFRAR